MKKMKLILFIGLVFFLNGCGKVTLKTAGGSTFSIDTSIAPTANADIQTCDNGMALQAPQKGSGAYCLDNLSHGTSVGYFAANQGCSAQGKSLCSSAQLLKACAGGLIATNATYYWTSDWGTAYNSISGITSYYGIAVTAATCGITTVSLASSWVSDYYCCEK
jgi:hypothetical protein